MKLVIGGAVTVVLLIIVIWVCMKFAGNENGEVAVEEEKEAQPISENS